MEVASAMSESHNTESPSTDVSRVLAAIEAACKDGMEPGPCVTCGKVTPQYLPTSHGPVAYCGECFTAELKSEHRRLLGEAKAAGFKTIEAWQDWQEAGSLPKGDWE
jgi:hypothetical protein